MSETGFSPAEREAMRERAEELRREKGGNKKAKNLEALHLDARTWYGMPAY